MQFYYKEITIDVPENTYFPDDDSEMLAQVLEKTHIKDRKVLEIGCGTGFLSVLLAKSGGLVTAVDINEEAVKATIHNAKMNDVQVNAFQSNLFENVKDQYELIVFNPPYLPVEGGEDDVTYAGGSTGREVIEKFIPEVKNHLVNNGSLLLLISSLTGEEETLELIRKQNMSAKIIARQKIPWEELIVIHAWLHEFT